MPNTTSHEYFTSPINRLKHAELSKSNWKHSKLHSLVHLLKPLLEKGAIKFNMDIGEYYAT